MGKHSGEPEQQGPYGNGPHPSSEESQQKADQFDAQYEANKAEGDSKNAKGEWRG